MYFPHGSPLGQTLHDLEHNMRDGTTKITDCQIIGVVQDTKYKTVRDETPPAIVYEPISKQRGLVGAVLCDPCSEPGRSAIGLSEYDPGTWRLTAPTEAAPFTKLFNNSAARDQLLSAMSGFFCRAGSAVERHRN